jgi:hypothetical protein
MALNFHRTKEWTSAAKRVSLSAWAALSTAETKCAKWWRESIPVELREKGREALASCLTDLVFGVVVSVAGCFRGRRVTGSAPSLLGCREPEAFTVHLEDMDMMGEASNAPVSRSDPKTEVHSSNGRLLVTSVAPRS